MGYIYFDYSYFMFMIPALILSLIAQARVNSAFNKYSKVKNSKGLTASDVAMRVLSQNGVTGVKVERVSGRLTDHFDPRTNVIRLSDDVYNSTSVAAIGVAAHEAGHAVQYAKGYVPIKIRSFLIPITQFGSRLAVPLVIVGLILPTQYSFVVMLGIVLYAFAVLFEFVTLPVEINASNRAISTLDETEILYGSELDGAKRVLRAAAMTYLAATFTAVVSLLRLVFIASQRSGRD